MINRFLHELNQVQLVKQSKKKKQQKKNKLMKNLKNYMMNNRLKMVGKYQELLKIIKVINNHHLFKKLFKYNFNNASFLYI